MRPRARGERDDQVAERHVGLEAAAGADAEDLLHAELHELLDHDRGRRAAHPARLHGDGLALERARVAEHPALGVPLDRVVEERLGDVLRAQRVAGQEAAVGVVAGLGTEVDRHRAPAYPAARGIRRIDVTPDLRADARRDLSFCAEDPVERVFLEDIARRGLGRFVARGEDGALPALCHVGANVVPSGAAAGRSPGGRAGRARMVIGEEAAVAELWDAARRDMPTPREDRPGQPVYEIEPPPAPGRPACARRRSPTSAARPGVRGRARRGDRNRPARPRPGRLPLADAGADRGGSLLDLGG